MSRQCKGRFMRGWHWIQCSRNATTERGYCKSHDPDLQKKRTAERHAKWEAEWKREEEAEKSRAHLASLRDKVVEAALSWNAEMTSKAGLSPCTEIRLSQAVESYDAALREAAERGEK
jgi:hypothetical protein